MQIIITMAGKGKRFLDAGYSSPKYMINVKGKSLFEWSMSSLEDYIKYASKCIFVVRKEDDAEDFIRQKCRHIIDHNIQIISVDHTTDGQATTCRLALPQCEKNESVLIYNIDTYVEPGELKYENISGDGHIPCFHAKGAHWSFVQTGDNNDVCEVREKRRISNNCSIGAYYFSSAELYGDIYREYYEKENNIENNEKYVAPMYNLMISKGMRVTMSLIDENKVHVLGTPDEVRAFENGEKI